MSHKQKWIGLTFIVLFAFYLMLITSVQALALASNDYTQWRQGDSKWNQSPAWPKSKYPNATEEYMSGAGCLVTSIAMLLRQYNVVTDSNVNSFNPWICNEALKKAGAFDSAADLNYPDKIAKAYPGFQFQGSKTYSLSQLQSLYNQGYACILKVNGSGGYNHFVAVKNVSGSTVSIMDPGWGKTNLNQFSKAYNILYFKTSGKTFHDPIGCVDTATASVGKITVSGWAFDLDAKTKALGVHVYVGAPVGSAGAEGHAITADKSRPDVAKAYSSYGIGNNHGFSDSFSTAKTGTQKLYFYAINAGGGTNNPLIGTKTVTIPKDSVKPSISNVKVTNITSKGYTVTCNVSDNVGIKQVKFPTWTANSAAAAEQDDLIWHVGTISGNTASYTVKVSEHKNEVNIPYVTHIYAYDAAGNQACHALNGIFIDGTAPVISNVKVANVTSEGFDLSCKVTDRSPVTKVQFPTCTDYDVRGDGYNGQDDLAADWENNIVCKGTMNGSTATYHVRTSDHNNEKGLYHVHIYAWDSFGNRQGPYKTMVYIGKNGEEKFASEVTKTWNGHTYKLIEGEGWYGKRPQWSEASAYCQSIGGHLATISSKEENTVIASMLSEFGTSAWIGGTDEEKEGTFTWITGEPFTYKNWNVGDPNNKSGDVPPKPENYVLMYSNGLWIDYTTDRYQPFVCELETADNPISKMKISLSKETFVYDGKEKKPTVIVNDDTKLLKEGTDYQVSYSSNVNAGTAKVVIIGTGSYSGKVEKSFAIDKAKEEINPSIDKEAVLVGDQVSIRANTFGAVAYTSENEDIATVDEDGKMTAKKAGTAFIMITSNGDDNHEPSVGILQVDIKEKTKDIASCTIQLEEDSYVYDDEEKTPAVKVMDGSKELKLNEDFLVSYADNIYAGKAKAIVEGAGAYTGTVEKAFQIEKADQLHMAYLENDSLKAGDRTKVTAYGTGAVAYSSSNEDVLEVDEGGNVSALKEGTASITVTFAGSRNYNAGENVLEVEVGAFNSQSENHTHTYVYSVTKEATCEEKGTGTYTCEECGDSYTQDIPAVGHTWDEGTESKAATCTEKGIMTYTCTRCGKTRTEELEALGHLEVTDEAVEATCASKGLTEGSHCSRCGNVIKAQEEIPAKEHVWGEALVVKQATCTEKGTEVYICQNCDRSMVKETPFAEHKWGSSTVIEKATCHNTGKKEYVCGVCGEKKHEEIPINPDKHTGKTEIRNQKEATHTEEGYTGDTCCSDCGTKLKAGKSIPVLPAEGEASIRVDDASIMAGKEITVPVSIEKNSGIAGFSFDIEYDAELLTLKNVVGGSILTSGQVSSNGSVVNWYTVDDIKENGEILKLTFDVAVDAAPGETAIKVLPHDGKKNLVNETGDYVPVNYQAGTLTIKNRMPGDVNSDGDITIADVVVVNRYVLGKQKLDDAALSSADVNNDGDVTIGDVVVMNRHVLGKEDLFEALAYLDMVSGYLGAGGSMKISVKDTRIEAGDTVDVPVWVEDNTGVAGIALKFTIPEGYTLNAIKAGRLLSKGTFTADGATCTWYADKNMKDDGLLMTLNLTASENAKNALVTVEAKDEEGSNLTDEHGASMIVDFAAGSLVVDSEALEESDYRAAENAIDKINALSDSSTEQEVQAARETYDQLTDAQKALVDPATVARLESAEKKVEEQKTEEEKANQAAASNVKDIIEQMDPNDEDSVKKAKEAYDLLTDAQKELVDADAVKKLNNAIDEMEEEAKKTRVSRITLSGLSHNIAAGRKLQLKAVVLPDNAKNKKLKWTSSNTKIATVNQKGLVTVKPKTFGKTVIIKAEATDGSGVKATWKIKSMKGIVKSVKISGKKKVKAGKKLKLKAKVKATKGANKKVMWTSNNKKYATVSGSGVVKALPAGKGKKVKITAMATDGSGKKKAITIKIK